MGRPPVLDSMDTISYPQKSEYLAKLPRLTSSTFGGKPYVRSQAVEDEIQMVLRLHESEWIPAARNVKTETLVFLIRRVRHGDEEVYGSPFQELNKHTTRIARRWFDNVKR